MKNVKITPVMLSSNELLPDEIRPKRFAIASNFITCIKSKQSGKSFFLLFNYEPQKWNQWYPYFYSTNGAFDCRAKTYADLMNEYLALPAQYPEINMRNEKAITAISNLLGIKEGILVQNSPIQTEYWIKYSKTQDVWTFYEIEFLQIVELPEIDFTNLGDVDLLPLEPTIIQEVLASGTFKGIQVVDNTIEVLKDSEMLTKLLEKSILI